MARHWRALALATLVATAVGLAGAVSADAQEPAKSAAKKAKAKAKAPEGEEAADREDAAKTPAKKKRQDPAEAQSAIEAALKLLEAADCVVVVTDHTAVDYARVAEKARLVVDTRGVMRDAPLHVVGLSRRPPAKPPLRVLAPTA